MHYTYELAEQCHKYKLLANMLTREDKLENEINMNISYESIRYWQA